MGVGLPPGPIMISTHSHWTPSTILGPPKKNAVYIECTFAPLKLNRTLIPTLTIILTLTLLTLLTIADLRNIGPVPPPSVTSRQTLDQLPFLLVGS